MIPDYTLTGDNKILPLKFKSWKQSNVVEVLITSATFFDPVMIF